MSKDEKLVEWFEVALMVTMWLLITFSILYTIVSLPFMVHEGDWLGIVRNVLLDIVVLAIGVVATWLQLRFKKGMEE
ncbi:hypothetical protein [Enterococcus phage vB_Efs6_KEN16]|uniref:Uncharacterized protein n=1 Tax=Enterococcus phage vB_Efs6_KEN16 TaxID=3138325 RepID=A0AAX4PS69_9CAUD